MTGASQATGLGAPEGAEPQERLGATPAIPSAVCAVCDSEQNMQRSVGKGGLNDACLGCFYIWYDGVGPCDRAEHRHQLPHVHGEDIRAYSLKAKVAETWPFDGRQCPVADEAEKERAAIAMARDSAANGDLPVPKHCQARAEGIAQ